MPNELSNYLRSSDLIFVSGLKLFLGESTVPKLNSVLAAK